MSSDREWLSFTSASGTPSLTASTGTLATGGSLIAVATGPDGSIYIGQLRSTQGIYRVTTAGVVTTLATSTSGVEGIAVAPDGTVYYSLANHTIQRRLPDGTTTTFAGASGVTGSTDATGTAARFYWPSGLGLDATGNLYVADRDNHRIRKVSPSGVVTTVAGSTLGYLDATGTAAKFNSPTGVAVGPDGSLFVADWGNYRVRRVDVGGAVTTFAGSGVAGLANGSATAAQFASPYGVAVDTAGWVYVADTGYGNGDFFSIGTANDHVRLIAPWGEVSTIAGAGGYGATTGFVDALPLSARFNVVRGVAVSPDRATVYVADEHNGALRTVPLQWPSSPVGNGVVAVTAAPNTAIGSRSGSITVGGQIFTVTQEGGSATVTPTTWSAPASGGTQPVTVSVTPAGTTWTATSDSEWLTLSAASGTGSGSVTLTAAATTSVNPRSATVTVAGQTVTVTQAGGANAFTVTPTTWSAPGAGGIQTVTIGATDSDAPWATGATVDSVLAFTVGQPSGLAVGANGDLFIAATSECRIYRYRPSSNALSVLAGSGCSGFVDGIGPAASFSARVSDVGGIWAGSLAVGRDGMLYVADGGNHAIRRVDPATAEVTTVAGGTQGASDGVGASARFNIPTGIAAAADGALYIYDNSGHLRRLDPTTGSVVTMFPQQPAIDGIWQGRPAIAVAEDGAVYWGINSLRRLDLVSGAVSTVATGFFEGNGLAAGWDGYLYFADTRNNRVARVNLATGVTDALASGGLPTGVAVSHDGVVYFSDYASRTVHRVVPRLPGWLSASVSGGTGSGTVTLTASANPSSVSSRSATATIAGATVSVTQAAGTASVSLSPTSWSAPAAGGTQGVTVTASHTDAAWTASSDQAWLTVSPSSGTGSGSITLTAAASGSVTARTATVTVGGQAVTVTQAGGVNTFSVSPTTWSVAAAGGTQSVTIGATYSDAAWTAASNQSWLTVSAASGTGSGGVTLTAAATTSVNPRSATVTVAEQTVTVTQAGGVNTFTVTPTTWNAAAAGGTQAVTLGATYADAAWTASSDQAWLTVSPTSGTGVTPLILTAAPTTTGSSRVATVTIGDQAVVVTQAGGTSTFTVSPTSWNAPATGGSSVLAVASTLADAQWTASSGASWLSLSSVRGTGGGPITVTAAKTTSTRQGTVTIAGITVTVTQTVASFTVSPSSWSAPASGSSQTISVTASKAAAAWTASSSAPWLTLSAAGGIGSGSVTMFAAPNPSGTSRSATVVIAGKSVTLTQAGAAVSLSPSTWSVTYAGGTKSVTVTSTSSEFRWSATSNQSWLTVSPANGTGAGSVTLTAAANTTTKTRSATVTIGGKTVTVSQGRR